MREETRARAARAQAAIAAGRIPVMLVDMDGTAADVSAIRHYVIAPDPRPKGWKPDFHSFHMESVDAPVNEDVRQQAIEAQENGIEIVNMTARRHMYRHVTAWFLALKGFPSDALVMRADSDQRPDVDVKRDMLNSLRAQGYEPVWAIDDNPAVLALWEEEGIPVTKVDGFEG